jgi:hypothetical protein
MAQEFSSNVIVANEYTLIGAGSSYNMLTINTAAVEIMANAVKLAGRTTLMVQAHPDNAGYIYLGLDNTVTAAKNFFCLAGGDGLTIKLDSIDNISIYAIGSAAGQLLSLLEGKSS